MEDSRNIWCPYYGECLDKAILHDKLGFSCSGCENQFEEKREIEDQLRYYRLLHAAFKKYDNDYRKGPYERLDAFAEYAFEKLPEGISENAIPSNPTLKRLNIPREPKKYVTEPDITHVNTLGPAHINPGWQYCGDEDLAKALGQSKSWVEKGKKEGWLAYDEWNKFSWYCQNSTDFLRKLIESGEIQNNIKSWQEKEFWTDCN